jgi:murein DD-endopeptidase MepM/ murein hydrolase activator NlpD
LWVISQDAGVTLSALMAANHLSEGAVLHSGQLLLIPAPDAIPAPMTPTPHTPTVSHGTSSAQGGGEHAAGSGSAPRTYTVAFGDTLWDISRDAGVSLGEILAVNQISETEAIHPGDILILPRSARDPALSSSRVSEQIRVLTSMDGVTMIWPTSGRITSGFGPRIHPIFGGREFHTGVDIGTRQGNDVRAALSGIVRFAGWMGGYGRIVILDHGSGLETAYAHLDGWVVARGQRVEQGQLIGVVGRTGWSTGPHLLFEIRRNGRPVNPMDYLHP